MYFIDSNRKYACITFEINLEELSLVQKMEKRIKNQVKPASLTSATTGRTINLKTVQKELDLFDATGERTPRMLKIMRAIETIPPTSVEAERAFSTAGLFITKLRTRLNNRSVDALCNCVSFGHTTRKTSKV